MPELPPQLREIRNRVEDQLIRIEDGLRHGLQRFMPGRGGAPELPQQPGQMPNIDAIPPLRDPNVAARPSREHRGDTLFSRLSRYVYDPDIAARFSQSSAPQSAEPRQEQRGAQPRPAAEPRQEQRGAQPRPAAEPRQEQRGAQPQQEQTASSSSAPETARPQTAQERQAATVQANIAEIQRRRNTEIFNKDLYAKALHNPVIQIQGWTDPDRMMSEMMTVGNLTIPAREVLFWSPRHQLTNLTQGGKPQARFVQNVERRMDEQGRPRVAIDVHPEPVRTMQEFVESMEAHPAPAIFFIPNAHLLFDRGNPQRDLMIHEMQRIYGALEGSPKTLVLQTPPGQELAPEFKGVIPVVKDVPLTDIERERIVRSVANEAGISQMTQAVYSGIVSELRGLTQIQAIRALKEVWTQEYGATPRTIKLLQEHKQRTIEDTGLFQIERDLTERPIWGFGNFEAWLEKRIALGGFIEPNSQFSEAMIILIGQQGTGKTESAKMLARKTGRPLYNLQMNNIMSKWVGDTERNIRQAMELIETSGKAVVLLDEIDKAFGGAGTDGNGIIGRIVSTVQTYAEDWRKRGVPITIVGTTNDARGLRGEIKGGRAMVFSAGMPSPEARIMIFDSKLHELQTRYPGLQVDNTVSGDPFVKAMFTAGMTGRDIERLLIESAAQGGGTISIPSIIAAEPNLVKQAIADPEETRRREAEAQRFPAVGVYEEMARRGTMYEPNALGNTEFLPRELTPDGIRQFTGFTQDGKIIPLEDRYRWLHRQRLAQQRAALTVDADVVTSQASMDLKFDDE